MLKPSSGKKWCVVGGGMMGMTLAYRLAERGEDVTICEAAPKFGGLTTAWNLGDVVWDKFYHVTLLSDSYLLALLDELGLRDDMNWVETRTGFYSGGKLHSMSNTIEFLKFPPLNLYQKLRLGGTIFYGSKIKDWSRLEKIPVDKWLRRWSGNSTFEKIWLPLIKAKLGDAYNQVSAAFIWAYIARMYKARRTGLKKEMFGYVPGGYARILDRFAEVLGEYGVQMLPDHPVENAWHDDETGKVQVQFTDDRHAEFDEVVFTIPSPMISKAVPALSDDEHHRLANNKYLGVICASLLIKKQLAGYYVTNITDTWVPLTGIIEMSAIVDPAELRGNHLIYLPKYVPSWDDHAFAETDESIRERFLSTLEKMYPHFSRDDVVEFKIGRAHNVMAMPTIRYSETLPPMTTTVPGVHIVNSAHIVKGNLNVNETIQIAEDGLDDILASAAKHRALATPKVSL